MVRTPGGLLVTSYRDRDSRSLAAIERHPLFGAPTYQQVFSLYQLIKTGGWAQSKVECRLN